MIFRICARVVIQYFIKPKVQFLSLVNMTTLEELRETNRKAEDLLKSVSAEADAIGRELHERKKRELVAENEDLKKQIEWAKQKLIELEISNGIKQIPLPGEPNPKVETPLPIIDPVEQVPIKIESAVNEHKPIKEKKVKKEKPAATTPTEPTNEPPIDVGRLDMRIGKIVQIEKHPDAENLYVEQIDCGESKARTIVSGLVKHVPIDEMLNRMVAVLCNLKPAKMRGVTSEGMVMCASSPDKVEVLRPPVTAVPGDLVHCDGYARCPDDIMNPKKKIFETVAPDLRTNDDLVACYRDRPLSVIDKGFLVADTLKNVPVR